MSSVRAANRITDVQSILDDTQEAYRLLEEDASRLFTSNELNVLVWPKDELENHDIFAKARGLTFTSNNASEKQLVAVTDPAALAAHIEYHSGSGSCFIIFQQEYTWGHILISLDAFKAVLTAFQVFTPFIGFIMAFGLKVSESDENFSTYHRRSSEAVSQICYNLRYPAKNGRTACPAWSMRHVAAYQQYNYETGSCRWLLVQPSESMKQKVGEIIQTDTCANDITVTPHLVVLSSSEKGWRAYLNQLQEEFTELDYKARFSRSTMTGKDSFYVCMGDSQLLHRRRQRLLKASAILDSCIDIAQGCENFCQGLGQASDSEPRVPAYFFTETELYVRKVQAHKRTVELLLKQSSGTLKLLFQVLQFRNDEEFTRSNNMVQHNSHVLTELGQAAKQENTAIMKLTEKGRSDSRSTKILTFIAMLYLPASLVATIFSSDLMVAVNAGDVAEQTRFVAATQFWIFPVSTMILVCITVVPLLFIKISEWKKGAVVANAP